MTQFTSFVAVEEMIVTEGGQPRRVDVPVEVPEGVNRSAVTDDFQRQYANPASALQSVRYGFLGRMSETVNVTSSSGSSKSKREKRSGAGGAGAGTSEGPTNTLQIDGALVLSPEDQKQQAFRLKLHPSLIAIVDQMKRTPKGFTPADTPFIRNGKAELKVWLVDKTPEALASLKKAGFEILLDPKTSKMVIGRISLDNLKKLAALKSVRYVAPQMPAK
jgi:Ca-activated chloride channel homolog